MISPFPVACLLCAMSLKQKISQSSFGLPDAKFLAVFGTKLDSPLLIVLQLLFANGSIPVRFDDAEYFYNDGSLR